MVTLRSGGRATGSSAELETPREAVIMMQDGSGQANGLSPTVNSVNC